MKTSKNKQVPTPSYATPPDPNRCFVLFSPTHLTAGSAAVSVHSLANQLNKHARDRPIKRIVYNEAERRLDIEFETGATLT